MRCLLCSSNFMTDETLRIHYIIQHSANENDYFFKDLFLPDNILKSCDIYMNEIKNCRVKKNHMFLFHYNLSGGSRMNQQLPVSVVTRDSVTYFSINYNDHKNFFFFKKMLSMIFCRESIIVLILVININFKDMLK